MLSHVRHGTSRCSNPLPPRATSGLISPSAFSVELIAETSRTTEHIHYAANVKAPPLPTNGQYAENADSPLAFSRLFSSPLITESMQCRSKVL